MDGEGDDSDSGDGDCGLLNLRETQGTWLAKNGQGWSLMRAVEHAASRGVSSILSHRHYYISMTRSVERPSTNGG